MKASNLIELLTFAIKNREPILIKGKPGIGKSDIVFQACGPKITDNGIEMETDLIISHPVVSDPTDYKGLPFANKEGKADFLPFGELNKLIEAKRPTVFFLDDLGQAPASVQAACMQLILARQINGKKVSDFVTFIAATNRKEDKAGVAGMLEPVKSRFASIVELDVDLDEWVKWALLNGMPTELIAFIRFKTAFLDSFVATKDITNTPTPRTIAAVGRLQSKGLSKAIEYEIYKGAAGEGFAAEYMAFLKTFRELPNIDDIILNPKTAAVSKEGGVLYALSGALAHRMNEQNIEAICVYLDRIPAEISVCAMKDALVRTNGTKTDLKHTRAFITWGSKNGNFIL